MLILIAFYLDRALLSGWRVVPEKVIGRKTDFFSILNFSLDFRHKNLLFFIEQGKYRCKRSILLQKMTFLFVSSKKSFYQTHSRSNYVKLSDEN